MYLKCEESAWKFALTLLHDISSKNHNISIKEEFKDTANIFPADISIKQEYPSTTNIFPSNVVNIKQEYKDTNIYPSDVVTIKQEYEDRKFWDSAVVMRESSNNSSTGNVTRNNGNGVVNLPLIQSFFSPNQGLFNPDINLMNHFALQALMTASTAVSRDSYRSELFSPNWQSVNAFAETSHIVSSSDQIIKQSRSSTNGKRKKRKEVSKSVPPISPPISASSPISNASSSEVSTINGTTIVDTSVKSDNKGKLHICKECHKSFGYKHVLQNHERTHTGEKPFECLECHKKFTRDHHLKTHMRLHTGEKPYQCEYCDRQFVQVANLRRHTRVHTGERPYACLKCASKFSDSNQLNAHMLIHDGKKPFECKHCPGKFRRHHHLIHHKCPVKDRREMDDENHFPENTDDLMDDDDSKCTMSDDTTSSDTIISDNYKSKLRSNSYHHHQPWISPAPLISIQHLTPIPQALNLSSVIPIQTEPEDLSMNKKMKYRSSNNNDSSGSAGNSSRSASPLDVNYSLPLS